MVLPDCSPTRWRSNPGDGTVRRDKVGTLPTRPACSLGHSELTGLVIQEEVVMNDAGTMPRQMLDVRELTAEAFAPYGQVIAPLRTGGQGIETRYDPEALAGPGPQRWIIAASSRFCC